MRVSRILAQQLGQLLDLNRQLGRLLTQLGDPRVPIGERRVPSSEIRGSSPRPRGFVAADAGTSTAGRGGRPELISHGRYATVMPPA